MKKAQHRVGEVIVKVKGKNVAVTPAMRERIVNKMGRLDKYLDRLQEIEVELCREHTRDANHQSHVEATTHVLGRTIRVTANDDEMYAAVDQAVDKLYRQLNRQKERVKSHHGSKLADTLSPPETALPEAPESVVSPVDEEPVAVVHIERLNVKPQFEDEALLEMDAQARNFFVFLNARTEQINVLYRRADGSFGLIEPCAG